MKKDLIPETTMKWRQVYRTKPSKPPARKFPKQKKIPIALRWALPIINLEILRKSRAVCWEEAELSKLRSDSQEVSYRSMAGKIGRNFKNACRENVQQNFREGRRNKDGTRSIGKWKMGKRLDGTE